MDQALTDLLQVVGDFRTAGLLAGMIAVVNLLTNLTKVPLVAKYVKPAWRPWVALGLGAVGSGLAALSSGVSIPAAVLTGLVSGFSAIGSHELLSTVGKKATERAAGKVVTDALKAPNEQVKAKVDVLTKELATATAKPADARMTDLANLANKM